MSINTQRFITPAPYRVIDANIRNAKANRATDSTNRRTETNGVQERPRAWREEGSKRRRPLQPSKRFYKPHRTGAKGSEPSKSERSEGSRNSSYSVIGVSCSLPPFLFRDYLLSSCELCGSMYIVHYDVNTSYPRYRCLTCGVEDYAD